MSELSHEQADALAQAIADTLDVCVKSEQAHLIYAVFAETQRSSNATRSDDAGQRPWYPAHVERLMELNPKAQPLYTGVGAVQPPAPEPLTATEQAENAYREAVDASPFKDYLDHRHTRARHRAGLFAVLALGERIATGGITPAYACPNCGEFAARIDLVAAQEAPPASEQRPEAAIEEVMLAIRWAIYAMPAEHMSSKDLVTHTAEQAALIALLAETQRSSHNARSDAHDDHKKTTESGVGAVHPAPADLWYELEGVIDDMRLGKTISEVSIATLRRVQTAIDATPPAREQRGAALTDAQIEAIADQHIPFARSNWGFGHLKFFARACIALALSPEKGGPSSDEPAQ